MTNLAFYLIPFGFLLSLTPWMSSASALLLGVFLALVCGNPHLTRTRKLTRPLLSTAIIALGAGMNLLVVGKAGMSGLGFTVSGLAVTMGLGWVIGRMFGTSPGISLLVNVGTAICGGSAIAAISSAIRSREEEISVALGIVFLLNACGLMLFPPLGHYFGLTEPQFGLWSALAIHDTSSVVGATLQYGPRALEVGTTVKLVRSLWIVPLTFFIAALYRGKTKPGEQAPPRQYPWFILGFLLASALVTWVPSLEGPGHWVEFCGKRVLTATLFLIGSGLTKKTLQSVGARPLLHGIFLWVIVAAGNLFAVLNLPLGF